MSDGVLYNALKAIKPLRIAVRRARAVRERHFRDVWRLTGPERHSGEAIRVFCAGQREVCRYIEQLVFAPGSAQVRHGRMWSRRVPAMLTREHAPCGLTFVQVHDAVPPEAVRAGVFVLPSWLAGELDVAHALSCQRGNDSVRTDLRNIRRQGFTSRLTRDPGEIERFYHTMYLPYVRQRHGERGFIATLAELERESGHGVELLLIGHGGREVAGAILGTHDAQRLDALELGVLGGDRDLVRKGALAAIYYFALQLAAQRGHTRLFLGGSRPFLTDGALRYKSKWGLRITGRLPSMPDRLLLRPQLDDPGAASFLRNNPFVYEQPEGAFRIAVFVGAQESAARTPADWLDGRELGGIAGVSTFRLPTPYAATARTAIGPAQELQA